MTKTEELIIKSQIHLIAVTTSLLCIQTENEPERAQNILDQVPGLVEGSSLVLGDLLKGLDAHD